MYSVSEAGVPSYAERAHSNGRELHQVIDGSDGDSIVQSFRNKALAERLASTSPAYRVRSYAL